MARRIPEEGAAPPPATDTAAGLEGSVEEDVFVTFPLAAQLSGMDSADLRRLIEAGTIETIAAGEMMLIPMSSLRRYLAGRAGYGGKRREGARYEPGA